MIFFYILIGISLVVFGIGILYDPIFHDTKHNFIHDFTGVKWPFGVSLTLVGVAFFYISFRRKSVGSASGFLICSSCRHPIEKKRITENQCPSCGADLEELDGFYDRHPELKEK
jgi:hypothetical protein